jgi:hypothetical protein
MNDNKPQIPAQGIMLHRDWGPSKMYKIQCDCSDPTHELTMDVEADDSNVMLSFYVKLDSDWWTEQFKNRYDIDNDVAQKAHWKLFSFLNGLWTRCRLTWRLWVKGYLEHEQVIMLNEQQAINLSHAIGDAVLDVKAFRKEMQNK